MTIFEQRHLAHALDGMLGARDSLVVALLSAYRVREPRARDAIADALEQSFDYMRGSQQTLEAALLPDEDAMSQSDDAARAAFARIEADITSGALHWVERRADYEMSHDRAHAGPSLLTDEERRERARERKARQRMQARERDKGARN